MEPTDKICLGIIVLIACLGFFFSSDFGIGTLNQWIPGIGDGYIIYAGVDEPFLKDESLCEGIHKNSCSGWISLTKALPGQHWCTGKQIKKTCTYPKWQFKEERSSAYAGSPGSTCMGTTGFSGRESDFSISASAPSYCGASPTISAITTEGFKNSNFRIDLELSHSGPRNSATSITFYLGDIFLYSTSLTIGETKYTASKKQSGLFEIVPYYLEPELIDIYYQGIKKNTVNISGVSDSRVTVKMSTGGAGSMGGVGGSLKFRNSRYQPQFSCRIDRGELLGIETFPGGTKLNYFSTRFPAKFCLRHPVIVTSEEGKGSLATAEPLMKLIRGEILQIPSDETWTLFYIFDAKEAGLTIDMCPAGETWDVNLGGCKDLSGIVYFCSGGGVWDSKLHACVVAGTTICEPGFVYDTATRECIWHPPQAIICPLNFNYDPISGKCTWEPEEDIICISGSVYNPIEKVCEVFPIQIICPPGSSYSSKKNVCISLIGEEFTPPKSKREACEIVSGIWTDDEICKIEPTYLYECKKGYTLVEIEDTGRFSCIPEVESKYPVAVRIINWLIENQTFIFFITVALISFICVGWYLMREE